MSTNLLTRLKMISKLLNEDKHDKLVLWGKLLTGSVFLFGHGVYTYSTTKNEIIQIDKKYKMNKNGFSNFMVIDKLGRHFNVNNSFWYNKWDSLEDWHKIENNKNILIKYYGFRIPILGLFPNIIRIN